MDNEIEITTNDSKGLVDKIKDWSYENWQTILVVLIVLIVGVSAYNYNQEENDKTGDNSVAVVDEIENNSNDKNNVAADVTDEEKEIIAEETDMQEAEVNDNQITNTNNNSQVAKIETEKGKVLSSKDQDGKTYTATASYGEGITHLARHAFNEYLQENNIDVNLSQEQKIYIEDYMQNRKGNQKIKIGHQETFSEGLIQEAISQASNLSDAAIQNLKKYIK
ncbi:hypothetical protein K0B03_01070 [Patescibacteria group bacterium]|nr:hypothetical protein [Patescibacteria group bacterium]